MKSFDYYCFGETILIGGRQYRAGEALTSYLNLNIERLDALYSACLSQKNMLLRYERSEEYGRLLHRCADTFNVVDRIFSRLLPYSRVEAENVTLISIMEKSPLFSGFDAVSADSEHIESWQKECAHLADMYLSALDALRFCRDTAAPFFAELNESGNVQKAIEALSAGGIELLPRKESIAAVTIGGEIRLCRKCRCESLLEFVQTMFSMAAFADVLPRPCGCCGKYFLPSNDLAKFCDRKAPEGGGKLCREVGARRKYEKKQKDNPISAAYNRAYKARYARMTAGKLTREELHMWVEKAAELRATALSENTDCEEFERQLKAL